MLILGIVLMVGSLWLTYRSDRERWKEYFRSTRKVYWVSLGCWALLFLLVYLWVVLGWFVARYHLSVYGTLFRREILSSYKGGKSMSTTENLLLGFGALVIGVVVLYFDLRSNWEYWKEYFRSTRKVYWVSLGCWALLFLLVYLWVVLGWWKQTRSIHKYT